MNNGNENNKGMDGAGNFSVPENYFQNSASSIINKLEWQKENESYPTLFDLRQRKGSEMGFSIPQYYFSQNEHVIERHQYPFLGRINKNPHFSVPENYFKSRQTNLIRLMGTTKKAKVMPLFKTKITVAVAALFLICLGFWMYTSYNPSSDVTDCKTLACVEKEDLVKSVNLENYENEDLYELLNSSDLELEQKFNSSLETQLPDSGSKKQSTTSL